MPSTADRWRSGPGDPNGTPGHRLRLALVNNMPEAARMETAAQLLGLVATGRGPHRVDIDQYRLTGPDLDRLEQRAPDLLIVTGNEPSTPELVDEPYWPDLARLISWAPAATTSVLLCCLAAHASLLLVDGLRRRALPVKCHGVFANRVAEGHRLTTGLSFPAPCPHSRANEVPVEDVIGAGWDVPLWSEQVGWTIASRMDGACRVVLAQGHPEYGRDQLLREYRRDVRRYVTGERSTYPSLPVGYLDPPTAEILSECRRQDCPLPPDRSIPPGRRSPDSEELPFQRVMGGIVYSWRAPAERLFANWIADAVRRSATDPGS